MLEEQGVEFKRRDYFRDRFTRDELESLLQRAGLTPRDVLSTRSRAYQQLDLANLDPGDDELLDLMIAEPTLLKRPIVISGDQHVVGFSKPQLDALVQG